MKTKTYETREDWLQDREGKITGSSLDDVFSVKEPTNADIMKVLDSCGVEYKKTAKKEELVSLVPEDRQPDIQARLVKKLAFYELLAYKVSVPEEGDEDPMDRGSRLEEEALKLFAEKTGKEVSNDLVMWVSDVNDALAYSPDGIISEEEVVETKCLSSAWHLYIYYEKDIPPQYRKQNLQAFIVNDKLQKLHFACYDPRIPSLPLHWITITREEVKNEIELYKTYELQLMEELEALVTELTF